MNVKMKQYDESKNNSNSDKGIENDNKCNNNKSENNSNTDNYIEKENKTLNNIKNENKNNINNDNRIEKESENIVTSRMILKMKIKMKIM